MTRNGVSDLLSKLDAVLSGVATFDELRAFVFGFYEAEDETEADADLESCLAVVAPYLGIRRSSR